MSSILDFVLRFKNDLTIFSGASLLSIVRLLSGLILLKVIAVIHGLSGVAIYGQIQNFTSIIQGVIASPVGDGVVKNTAENKNNSLYLRRILSTALLIAFIIFIVLTAIVLIFESAVKDWLNIDLLNSQELLIILFFGLISSLGVFLVSILNGFEKVKKVITVSLVSMLIALVLTIGAMFYMLNEIILVTAFYLGLIGVVQIIFISGKYYHLIRQGFSEIDIESIKKITPYIFMASVSFIVTPAVLIELRGDLIHNYNLDMAGDWESSRRLISIFSSVLTSYFALVLIPKLSNPLLNNSDFRNIINANLLMLAVLMTTSFLLIYTYRDFVYTIVYDESFKFSTDLFVSRMLGEFLKLFIWLYGLIFIVKTMTVWYVSTSIASGLLMLISSKFLLEEYGIIGVNYGYIVSNLIMLILVLIVYLRHTDGRSNV
jgi:PST family polysaccharide transporter